MNSEYASIIVLAALLISGTISSRLLILEPSGTLFIDIMAASLPTILGFAAGVYAVREKVVSCDE